MNRHLAFFLAAASLVIPAGMQAKTQKPVSLPEAVRHQLAMMPRFNVFDDISFRVDGSTITLTGQVTQPVVKADATGAVKSVEGVTQVVNNIEVLPLSAADDQIRRAELRAIYGAPTLAGRYQFAVQPPIRIIVKNGVVRLEGVVANKMDHDIAGIRANGVFGAFKVINNLKIES
jgi:hyperosmotically inducible protein